MSLESGGRAVDVLRNLLYQTTSGKASRSAIDRPKRLRRLGYFGTTMSYGGRLGYMKLPQTTAALRAVLARSTSGLPRAVRVAVDSTSCKTPLSRITSVAEIRDGRVKRRVLVRVVNCSCTSRWTSRRAWCSR